MFPGLRPNMDKTCIIGGSGFIGTRLCKRLESIRGTDFVILDKRMSQMFPDKTRIADVRDIGGLRGSMEGNIIVNLAAEHRDDVKPRSLYWDVNVEGARNICKVAEEKGIDRLIFTSSVAVYGFTHKETFEDGELKPFNDYGITKLEAEKVYKEWQIKDPSKRTLVIIRPTVVFGEGNRGNVYNLLNQIVNGRFIMVGNGKNIKSMAYVENVASFIEYSLSFSSGLHIYNYIDKPDFDMETLVRTVYQALNKPYNPITHIPYPLGYLGGKIFDFISLISGKSFPISSIRIKKFCANTCFGTSISKTGFSPPVSLKEGLIRTIQYEFLESHPDAPIFLTE